MLTIAVLAILLTAPIGAAGISITGPLLLNKKKKEEKLVEDGQEEDVDQTRETEEEKESKSDAAVINSSVDNDGITPSNVQLENSNGYQLDQLGATTSTHVGDTEEHELEEDEEMWGSLRISRV